MRSLKSWHHTVRILGAPNEELTQLYTVFGANCFESDVLGSNVLGPSLVQQGDLVVISNVGGYDIPSANTWTRPLPAVVTLEEGQPRYARRRQSFIEMRSQESPNSLVTNRDVFKEELYP